MRIRTTATAGLLVTAALSFGFTGTANAADRDCPDFPSQAAAQAALLPGDPERLDADDDGQACEDYDYASVAAPAAPATTGTSQVATVPSGAVAAGDGSSSGEASMLPYAIGGVALIGAAGAAAAARRARSAA